MKYWLFFMIGWMGSYFFNAVAKDTPEKLVIFLIVLIAYFIVRAGTERE